MYINLHTHTDYSNAKFRDAISTVEGVMKYTKELGHNGCCFTEHENTCSSLEAILTFAKLSETDDEAWKDFKVLLGNEIYLTSRPEGETRFPTSHFILIAKDIIGFRQLKELSTTAWIENSYKKTFWITPTFYDDLVNKIKENPNHLIGSTACLGGYCAKLILEDYYNGISGSPKCKKWLLQMKQVFGVGNFFLEMQPSNSEEQVIINGKILELSAELDIPYIITTDAHYEKKEDSFVHEAFLKAQEAEREVASFYATTYLMSEVEIHEYMDKYMSPDVVQKGIDNTQLIYNMCENYDIQSPLDIPYIPEDVREPDAQLFTKYNEVIPTLSYFYNSQFDSDRHLARDITERLERDKDELQNQATYTAVEDNLVAVKLASEKQETQWSGYLLQTRQLINECWKSDSLVGPSRGSGGGFILLYLLDIIQINPVREKVPLKSWRFLNPERVSPLDVDVDVCGYKRAEIIENLRAKYGGYQHISEVQTLMREKSKSAIQTAMRGLGYNDDDAVFVSSFVKAERGIQYTLSQVFYGDEENGIKPDKEFVRLMTENYPDVWKVATKIEGLIKGVGAHAGGVILSKHNFTDSVGLMKTNSGKIITQFDLHNAERVGLIKWDLLGIDALEKIQCCLNLLTDDAEIQKKSTLKETYMEYLNPYVIEREDPKMWDMLLEHRIMSFFQMEKTSGYQAVQIGQPHSVEDLSALNSVMRLMAFEGGGETPLERYGRFKKDVTLWYKEMRDCGLTEDEIKVVRVYGDRNYGLLPNQEDFMMVVQDPMIGGFSLLWADKLRKSVAKKNPKEFLALEKEFYENIETKRLSFKLCDYVWQKLVKPNAGYGFNIAHTLAYSLVGVQEANLAYKFPIVYWNTANLIVDSGSMEGNEDSGTRYGKMAIAMDELRNYGQMITLPNVNEAGYSFKPKADDGEVVFALKAIQGCNAALARAIIENRPYTSLNDFIEKMSAAKEKDSALKLGDTVIVNLIKAGCFDAIESIPREEIMAKYIRTISNPLSSLGISALPILIKMGLVTPEQKKYECRLFKYAKYVCDTKNLVCSKGKSTSTNYYKLDHKFAEPYFMEHFESIMTEGKDYDISDDGFICVKKGSLDKVVDKLTADFKQSVLKNPDNLAKINDARFLATYQDKAQGTISRWEMETLSYYYHEHELAHVRTDLYAIEDFKGLPPTPVVAQTFLFKTRLCHRFKLSRIFGTVIDKDKLHETITLLTPTGVVLVKFQKGQFGFYDRQLSEINEDGSKTVIEKSWFKRGNKLMITGYRRENQFVAKKYKDSIYNHTVALIIDINTDNTMVLQTERVGEGEAP